MRFVAVLVAVLSILVSCDQSANRVSTLWTNVPEISSAVERFNASQREWQLLVEYREDPASLLTSSGVKADLVIARNLASAEVKGAMVPLDFLFDGGSLAKASFFQRSLDAGMQGDRQRLLPLSFDLPVLVYSRTYQPDLVGFSLTVEQVKELGDQFDASPLPKNFRRQAFSPRWGGFAPTFLHWTGASFQEGFQGELSWNNTALAAGLLQLQHWPSPGWEQTSAFQKKYLQMETSPALIAGRIQFYPSTLANFLNRPWKERRDLDFRFLDQNGRVLATDSTVWAGIPSSSLTRGASERFLSWFFQAENQKTLLSDSEREDDRNFGLAQGVPALVGSATLLTELDPTLAGRLPAGDQVTFWPTLPADWTTLKTSVLRPWLESATATVADLRTGLERQRAQGTRR